jgi:hypothetical protein
VLAAPLASNRASTYDSSLQTLHRPTILSICHRGLDCRTATFFLRFRMLALLEN